MSLANLSDLTTAVAEWLYRTGDTALAARANDFVSLFEADFVVDPDMRTAEMQEVDTTPITSAVIALPVGFIDMVALTVTGQANGAPNQPLSYVTPEQAAELNATASTTGIAKWYTVKAGQIYIAPAQWAPIGATLEMTYYVFTGLAASAGNVNWLLQKYPNLYLYGSLMQAAAYVDDNETTAKWKSGRDETMQKLAKTELKRRIGAGPLRRSPSANFVI